MSCPSLGVAASASFYKEKKESFNLIMKRPFSLVNVRTSGQGDHCITLPGSAHIAMSIATSLATLTSKSKLEFKSVEIK